MTLLEKYIHEKLADLNLDNKQTAILIGKLMEAAAEEAQKEKPEDFESIVDNVLMKLKF